MDFFDQLVRFETELWNAVERRLIGSGHVGLATLQALRVVDRHGDSARVHELSHELSITMGAASKLVDRLERGGMAVRRPHPDDRRSSLISLTPAGRSARRSGEQTAHRFIAQIIDDRDEARDLAAALSRLQTRITRVSEEADA
jgi:MarR family multiple antibiotic resistance transcriptional regulator